MIDLEIIAIVLSIFSFGISVCALFINWKKFQRDKPKLKAIILNECYENHIGYNSVSFDVAIQFINQGQAPGSVTDIKAFIRYQEKLYKRNPQLKYENREVSFSARTYNFIKYFPLKVDENGAVNQELRFTFNNINFEYLDRCQMPINCIDSKKWEWIDLPILIKFVADSSSGQIELMSCVFRYNQEESKNERGTIDYACYDKKKDSFIPKVDFND